MANIDNLINKIIEDANKEADSIIAEGEKEKEKIISSKIEEANRAKESMIIKTKREAATRKERVISNAQLKVRNDKLGAKQQVIDRAFEEAVSQLEKITGDELKAFVKNTIKSLNLQENEEIIVNEKYSSVINNEFIEEVNKSLEEIGKKGNIKLSSEKRKIEGGFILTKGGIELNYTFKSLVENLRNEIEQNIIKTLFV